MARMKTFFIYFLLIVGFFVFSQIMIYFALNGTYKYKNVDVKSSIPIEAEVKATSIDGVAKGKIYNNTENAIENKYVKVACYSKNDTLMGTKYIKIDKKEAKEEKEFEVRFNFNKVDRAEIALVEEQALTDNGVTEEQKISDSERGLAAVIGALILLYFI